MAKKSSTEKKRYDMVVAFRKGASMRSVARQFGFSLLTVLRWVQRAQSSRLDRVEWYNRPAGPHRAANHVARAMEDLILNLR